ncbi:hydroxysqualene dehydroxylase HpnE [Yinghuangia seranimata]|uniref:hydroxysqualene dehydroxylase HpnE n=1 Tax=Yinghuangia seranimata TaxID=408067 RepID=UPI00248B9545|nr:hydroxysqualene dehydroxylase HpnE [Yinghuangia seranimata]MDI2125282.1 hydroxysqualene dehydroxylase HpnE [Yinghuangia seranimata]
MTRRLIVVGGGLAGITAALTAADAGAHVTLLEGRPRLGGATFSFRRDGRWLDNGQHVFLRCCTEYRRLLDRIGSTDKTVLQDRLDVPVLTPWGTTGRLKRTALPSPLHLSAALSRYPFLTLAGRARVGVAALALKRLDLDDPRLDETTFGAWLDRFGVTERERAAMWDLVGVATLNLTAEHASLAMAAKVFRTGLLDTNDGADIGWSRVPLQELHGDAAQRALEDTKAEVRLRARVSALDTLPGGGFTVTADGATLDADAVVLAVPHEDAARLLPAGALILDGRPTDPTALAGLGASPIVNLHVLYDRPVFREEFAAGLASPVQWVFDRSANLGLERGRYLAVSLSAADDEIDRTNHELRERYLPALERLLPATRAARVEEFVVTKERTATFRAAPGTGRLRPYARTAVPGLALAGAWTATGWPATMESAVRSGLAAAQVALPSLDLDPGRVLPTTTPGAFPERTTTP